MKYVRKLLLILLFSVGFTLQNCDKCPPFEGDYFDIQGMEVVNYTTSAGNVIRKNQVVEFPFYRSLSLKFEVNYLANTFPHEHSNSFSLINSAYGEDCSFNGALGSKVEKIRSLTVYTLNDFNEEYRAKDAINELLLIPGTQLNIDEFLVVDTSRIRSEEFKMNLSIRPELNDTFHVKVVLELSTNEIYKAESVPFIIR